jgi:AcrR family transcriptional regulator
MRPRRRTTRRNPLRDARSRDERFPKLKPGPGRSPEEVAAHQRRRLQEAMVELVAERGYEAISVAMLSERAAVSKRDFYKHFGGKQECFLSTYDAIVQGSVREILAAVADEEDECGRLRVGFLAFAEQIADSPETARLALVEVFAAGPAAVERILHTNLLFEVLVAKTLALPGERRLPRLLVKGIVGGGARVARSRLLSGQPGRFGLDGDELMEWALAYRDDHLPCLNGLPVSASPLSPAIVPVAAPGDERALILTATAKLAANEGYAALTVPRIRAAAGLSRHSFDAHFKGVPDCFLATLDLLSDRILAAAAPAYVAADDWATGVHRTIVALCHLLAHDPTFARLAFLEGFAPGAEAVLWRGELIGKLATTLRGRAESARRPGELAAEASVGAMWAVIHHLVATGRAVRLPAAAPVLSYLALAPALGAAPAIEVIVSEARRGGGAESVAPPRLPR